ncbi:MAG: VTT domain-containing protein [Candidatus Brocadiales bacterium]|nr:VTT domain-containing protein [Candidatus Bathyanammoxibius amoris]
MLLIVMALAVPAKIFQYVLVCSAGSVLGGCFGYFIGYELFEYMGKPIIDFYGLWEEFDYVSTRFHENAFAAIAVAGFTPIPYKLFTIAAGVCKINFTTFVIASILSRGLRFLAEGALIYFLGERVKPFVEKYFNVFSILFVVLLILGFIIIKMLSGQ